MCKQFAHDLQVPFLRAAVPGPAGAGTCSESHLLKEVTPLTPELIPQEIYLCVRIRESHSHKVTKDLQDHPVIKVWACVSVSQESLILKILY